MQWIILLRDIRATLMMRNILNPELHRVFDPISMPLCVETTHVAMMGKVSSSSSSSSFGASSGVLGGGIGKPATSTTPSTTPPSTPPPSGSDLMNEEEIKEEERKKTSTEENAVENAAEDVMECSTIKTSEVADKLAIDSEEIILVPKALVIACRRPWYNGMAKILLQIFRMRQKEEEEMDMNMGKGKEEEEEEEEEMWTAEELVVQLLHTLRTPVPGGRGVEIPCSLLQDRRDLRYLSHHDGSSSSSSTTASTVASFEVSNWGRLPTTQVDFQYFLMCLSLNNLMSVVSMVSYLREFLIIVFDFSFLDKAYDDCNILANKIFITTKLLSYFL